MPKGITLEQWVRDYGLEGFEPTPEEIAWGVVARLKTPATPELLAYLKVMIAKEGIAPNTGD